MNNKAFNCLHCGLRKAPFGRSVPMQLSLCNADECSYYYDPPEPDCRWPGEETCEIGCTKGRQDE